MEVISALIGLLAGISLTVFAEIVRNTSRKKLAATKLYTESVLTLKEMLESEFLSFEGTAKIIYMEDSYKDPKESQKKLEDFLAKVKSDLLKDKSKFEPFLMGLNSDKFEIEKNLYHIGIFEEKYRNDTFILPKNEISYLSLRIQPHVMEMIENYFNVIINFKFFLLRLKEGMNYEKNVDDYIGVIKYFIKIHKDRRIILNYSNEVSKKGFIRNLFN
jgi:hypothetical protein